MLTPEYVKQIFEIAIKGTLTYSKAEIQSFKFTIPELKDMLLEEQLYVDQNAPSGDSSINVFRQKVASTRGRGGHSRGRGGSRGSIPGKDGNLNNLSQRSKHIPSVACSFCKKKGHDKSACFRALRLCFNCGKSNKHRASECPYPNVLTNPPSASARPASGSSSKFRSKPAPAVQRTNNPYSQLPHPRPSPKYSGTGHNPQAPRLYKLSAGQAKNLSKVFRQHPDSVFSVVGPSLDVLDDDSTEVYVAMGAEEAQHASSLNVVCEKSENIGKALAISENIHCFSAIVDTGCTEHMTPTREYLSNFRRLQTTRTFKCANASDDADLTANFCGDIDFLNNGQPAQLQRVLFCPGLTHNLFSVRKIAQAGINAMFSKDRVDFMCEATGKIIKSGYFCGGLWWVDFPIISATHAANTPVCQLSDPKKPKLDVAPGDP